MQSNIPHVVNGNLSSPIDHYLCENLDKDGILKLKAVEETISFFIGKGPTLKDFEETYTKIYNFYKYGNNKELRSGSIHQ